VPYVWNRRPGEVGFVFLSAMFSYSLFVIRKSFFVIRRPLLAT
jgi:hypothetical protein